MMEKINVSEYFKLGYVYYLWDGDDVVYVGQSTALSHRIRQHLSSKLFDSFSFIRCSIDEMDELEGREIMRLNPKYNRQLNEKNGYCSINRVLNKAYKYKHNNRNLIVGAQLISKFLDVLHNQKVQIIKFNNIYYVSNQDIELAIDIAIAMKVIK